MSAARAGTRPERPRVVTLEWLDPLMLGGSWTKSARLAAYRPLGCAIACRPVLVLPDGA
jgi:hypothetical protein